MKLKKVTLNTSLMLDTLIAGIVVVNVPKLLNQFLPSLFSTTSNYIEAIIGGGSAYLVGMVLGKPQIANIGIALAGVGIANDFITPMISAVGSSPMTVIGDYKNLQESKRLAQYTNSINAMNYAQYAGSY